MANNNVNFMQECLDISHRAFASLANSFLWKLTKEEIDEIPTIKVSIQEKEVFDKWLTIVDVNYPNDKGFIPIYCFGSGVVKLTT